MWEVWGYFIVSKRTTSTKLYKLYFHSPVLLWHKQKRREKQRWLFDGPRTWASRINWLGPDFSEVFLKKYVGDILPLDAY